MKTLVLTTLIPLVLMASGCSVIPALTPNSASPAVHTALDLYRSGQHDAADSALAAIYDASDSSDNDRRRALATAILIQLERNDQAALQKAQDLLVRYDEIDSEVNVDFFLLRESLDATLAARAVANHRNTELHKAQRRVNTLQQERAELEKTLKKLRELSLE